MSGRKPEVSIAQLVAGALATATAAVGASYLGVGGTIIGAVVMSIVTTAGGAIYHHYIERGTDQLKQSVGLTTLTSRAATRGGRTTVSPADGQDGGAAAPTEEARETGEAATSSRPRWHVIAGASLAVFLVVMGGITVFEAVTGEPLSSSVHGREGSGTTWSNVDGGDDGPAPVPVTPTMTSPAPASTQPTDPATGRPTRQPTPEPTTSPRPGPSTSRPALPSAPPSTGGPPLP